MANSDVAMNVRRVGMIAVGVVAVGVVAVLLERRIVAPVTVRVRNETPGPMTKVEVATVDELRTRNGIEAGGECSIGFHPKLETAVDLRWRSQAGDACAGHADVYLERGIRGTVYVRVLGCHELKIEDRTTIPLF